MNQLVCIVLTALLFGCAEGENPEPPVAAAAPAANPAEDSSVGGCPRYQERTDTGCQAVSVTGIESSDLSFTRAGYTLHGTVVRPVTKGEYRAPGVVLMHGSGPNDRDENASGSLGYSYGQNVPIFRQLAEYLAQQGMAVYRYDKRACFRENSDGRCPVSFRDYVGDVNRIYISDFVLDARAAVQALRQLPWVDGEDITVIGHSEGANFVPLLVADEPGVVAGVQLGGPATPIDQAFVGQLRDLADELERTDAARFEARIARLRESAAGHEVAFQQMKDGTFEGTSYLGLSVEQWLEWIEHTSHLKAQFQAVKKPLFVLNGDMDLNVSPRHLEMFRAWANEAGMQNVSFLVLPHVTHSFVTWNPLLSTFDLQFSHQAREAISEWHRQQSEPQADREEL